jgi:PKD repeat protein
VNLQELVTPPNDNIGNAVDIMSLPFNGSVDNTSATNEPGEPQFCSFSPRTVWYKFTPPASGFFVADMAGSSFFDTVLNVYQVYEPTTNGLSFVTCATFGGSISLPLTGGTTYYFQAGDQFTGCGDLHFNLQEIQAPQPIASFGFFPGDPSVFDNVQFFDQSFDPGGVGIQSQAWNFGDAATATGCCTAHRYAADGDYTVQLTVTTFDGRTASTSQTVSVRTHDVAITKFQVPTSAKAGQTRQIDVGLRNANYPEVVRVELYKSKPSGFQLIGFLEQSVPVRSGNRTTDFSFSYTFTNEDAAIGKVNFRAVAVILTARDALPTDNEAISAPTKVAR